jgi:hypothetical protein
LERLHAQGPDLTPIPVPSRAPTAAERQLIEVLLRDELAPDELRGQLEHAEVVARCGCGCPSVNLAIGPAAPAARYEPGETPYGRVDWVPITATGTDADGEDVEVTLHVCDGYLSELEIWSGYGRVALPDPDTLALEARLAARTEYALALAVAERMQPVVPAGVDVRADASGSIVVRVAGEKPPAPIRAVGDLETAAEGFLNGIESCVAESLGVDRLPCPAPGCGDECACVEGHAELVGEELRLWYGPREHPTLVLPSATKAELARLSQLWAPAHVDP